MNIIGQDEHAWIKSMSFAFSLGQDSKCEGFVGRRKSASLTLRIVTPVHASDKYLVEGRPSTISAIGRPESATA